MLAIFKNDVMNAPKELHSPDTLQPSSARAKTPKESLKDLFGSSPTEGSCIEFADKVVLGYVPPQPSASPQRMFCGVDDVYCSFIGNLTNLCSLNKQYGLSKSGNEATLVIEAYRTLRDRCPIPAHQVLKELEGSFGFVIYDHKAKNVFVALGADKVVSLYWGIASDGSVMISDNVGIIKASCRKSYAPFPPGCMYHSSRGLISFEHPSYKMKAMPRIDSEGSMCGSYFAVDVYSKVNSMPRVGSQTNWAIWD